MAKAKTKKEDSELTEKQMLFASIMQSHSTLPNRIKRLMAVSMNQQ
jgi:hypothetical protein